MSIRHGNWRLCATNYPHPDIVTGQHTNGTPRVWVEVDGVWHNAGSTHMHKVIQELERNGAERIVNGTWSEYGHERTTP